MHDHDTAAGTRRGDRPHGGHRHGHFHGDNHDSRRFARGFGFGEGHRQHGGGPGRRRRVFDHGDLRFVLLRLIDEQPRHGYELIRAIEEAFGGMYSPSPGVIYPTLTLLEELGYAAAADAPGGRKQYTLTDAGRAFLEANRPLADAIVARMTEQGRAFAGGPAPEIRRAMHNLEQALAIRLSRGPLSAEQVQAVTAILDRAAGEVERS